MRPYWRIQAVHSFPTTQTTAKWRHYTSKVFTPFNVRLQILFMWCRFIRFWVCVSVAEGIAVRAVDRLWSPLSRVIITGCHPHNLKCSLFLFPFWTGYYQDFLFLLLSMCCTPLHYSAVYFIPFHLKKPPPPPYSSFRHLVVSLFYSTEWCFFTSKTIHITICFCNC